MVLVLVDFPDKGFVFYISGKRHLSTKCLNINTQDIILVFDIFIFLQYKNMYTGVVSVILFCSVRF